MRNKMHLSRALGILLLAIQLHYYMGNGQNISDTHVALFVFGDSLYDVGMNAYFKNGTLGWNSSYGETYFKTATGRYSDGRLIPDFITQYAELPFLEPYLKPNLTNYTNGINFAAAGACVLSDLRPGTINLKMQVDYFLEMVEKVKAEIGDTQTSKLLKQAVYLFSIGGNDYATLVSSTISNQSVLTSDYTTHYISMVVGNLSSHIQTIHNAGGIKFAFQNVGPVGCIPSTKQIYYYHNRSSLTAAGNCAELPNTLAKTHNSLFLETAENLQTQLSGFNYTVFDSYTLTYDRVQNNTNYGFGVSSDACCGTGKFNGRFSCADTTVNFSLCSNVSDYLFFDAAHPTDKANSQFSLSFWNGSSTAVSPYTMEAFFNIS